MCRGGIVLAGIRRLCLFLFSLGDFGSSRLLHLSVGNSIGEIWHGLAHFKERRLPLMFQHDLLCVGQRRLIDTRCLDRLHKPMHLRIVPDTKGMIFERM